MAFAVKALHPIPNSLQGWEQGPITFSPLPNNQSIWWFWPIQLGTSSHKYYPGQVPWDLHSTANSTQSKASNKKVGPLSYEAGQVTAVRHKSAFTIYKYLRRHHCSPKTPLQ